MNQRGIAKGKLIVVINVAPVKPAEFVIIRIGHQFAPPHKIWEAASHQSWRTTSILGG